MLAWKEDQHHLPLLIRGARQVGKSSVVRHFGKQFRYFVEVNFEMDKSVNSIFTGNLHPKPICEQLSVLYNLPIIARETLLFFDEIQSSIPAILSLRFFHEHYPELHVIVAGSLLEFAITELPAFGVGCIRSIFLYPISFGEFLNASESQLLRTAIASASPSKPLPASIHNKAIDLYKRFLILGGMPNVVKTYLEDGSLLKCQRILDNLILSLEDDFAKYKKRASPFIIREVFKSVAEQCWQKFVFSKAFPELNRLQVKEALDLLGMAGLIIPVTHTAANGISLGTEINPKMSKYIVFDTGIFQRIMGLTISEVLTNNTFQVINKGAIAELWVGTELIKTASCYERQTLYYWRREAKSSNAEVDYLIQLGMNILPIEVKAATKGSMQSLFLFMERKKMEKGIRVSMENFSVYGNIEVFPLYAVSNLNNV